MSADTFSVAGEHPLPTAGESWLITSGEVHLFARHTSGRAVAARSYVYTARTGDRLFNAGHEMPLSVVGGAESTAQSLPLDDADQEARTRWLEMLRDLLRHTAADRAATNAAPDHPDLITEIRGALDDESERIAAADTAMVRGRRAGRVNAFEEARGTLRTVLNRPGAISSVAPTLEPLDAAFAVATRALGSAVPDLPAHPRDGNRLEALAEAARIRIRTVRLEGDWWREGAGPLVGYRADGHPVALVPAGSGRYLLVDPSRGSSERVNARVASSVQREAVSLYRPLPAGPVSVRQLVTVALRPVRPQLARVAVYLAASALASLVAPIVTGLIVGEVIPQANTVDLAQLVAALVVATVAAAFFQTAVALTLLRIQGAIGAYAFPAVWDRLLALPVSFFRRYSAGDLALRAQAAESVQRLCGSSTALGAVAAATIVANVVFVWFLGAGYGVALTAVVVAAGVVIFVTARGQARSLAQAEDTAGQLGGIALELIRQIRRVRVFGATERALLRWTRVYRDRRLQQNAARRAENRMIVTVASFPALATLALLVLAGSAVPPPAGQFLAAYASFAQVVVSVGLIASAASQLTRIAPTLRRLEPVLSAPVEDETGTAEPGVLTGAVEFSGISYRYFDDGPWVLRDVSIRVPAGSSVALVGPSGSGKSTLARLLLGFDEPTVGGIFLDDQDLAGLNLRSVRRQMGVVLQAVDVLPGSLLSNILGDATDLTVEDAWNAATRAGLADDIRAMPLGMLTPVGEGGDGLSGGQRQRLLIARALVARPRIVVLDEATSALDNLTQATVSATLAEMSVTRISIAHRLSTVREADRIYYLENGRVIEEGTYGELMRLGGAFAAQARRQLA